MPVTHDELCTSVLVTGVTGSSKTAGVLLPALAQLLRAYNRDGDGDPFQKLGAFIPEVKGDLVDACVYLAHEAGRCVSREVVIVSPSCRIPVVRCRDERGRAWHLAARGGCGGSEAGDLLSGLAYPPGHAREGSPVAPSAFEEEADPSALLEAASRRPAALGGRRPRFVGWRWEGPLLRRVSRTVDRSGPEWLDAPGGAPIRVEPPAILRAEEVLRIDSGVRYNLIDPRLPPAEAAERLTRLAAMVRGGRAGGENDYFYDQGRKLIAACIALHREVSGDPCTAVDVVRLATQDERLAAALARLEAEVGGAGAPGGGARRDLLAYFRDEWLRMVADGRTANVIRSTISAAFGPFLQDPDLAETFCSPSTFSFEDTARLGRIIGLVPGDRYEQVGRLLGAACKLDFQAALLSRVGRPGLNPSRLVVYFADECHKYAASGSSSAGDPSFMNLSRSANVANICATQSYAWLVEVIGREAANVYLAAFGVQFWLQQTDPETCRRASEICGVVRRRRVTAEHEDGCGGFLAALATGREPPVRRTVGEEERPRIRPEEFSALDVGEVIAYNKGRPGPDAKVVRGRARYLPCTRRPGGPAAVSARMREYYRELLENLAHERGETSRWDAAGPT
jgi:TraM recognition site of TraD and TraG